MITIIDYGMGNLGSILNMCKKIGVKATLTDKIEEIETASKLLLPGVGAFDTAMKNLTDRGLIPLLNTKVIKQHTPILGICLGMQLLTSSSEEGKAAGLGWIAGETVKFHFNHDRTLKIPHMGWNSITIIQHQCGLFKEMPLESRFYFVHSYYVKCRNTENILATTPYGGEFTSAIVKNNIYGVQFHPEKSHKFGMKLLKNFSEYC